MPSRSRWEAEDEVKSWGFRHVFTWSDGPYVICRTVSHVEIPLGGAGCLQSEQLIL